MTKKKKYQHLDAMEYTRFEGIRTFGYCKIKVLC